MDLVGPLPPSNGYSYLLTVVDRFTRWPEAIPLKDTTDLTSDRGPQFTSQLWQAVAQLLGTRIHLTTAYHPQANGLVERFHRHLKSALRARLTGPNWTRELPWVLLGIRTAPKEDFGCSSVELVYGVPLTVPGDFITEHGTSAEGFQRQRLRDQVRLLAPIPHHSTVLCHPMSQRSYSRLGLSSYGVTLTAHPSNVRTKAPTR